MDWDGYTVFSVIAGIACILLGALARDVSDKSRIWAVLGGVFFIGYGIYVAAQDSGTYYFSVFIFVLPFLLAGKIVYDIVKKRKPPTPTEGRLVSNVDKKTLTSPDEHNETHDVAEGQGPR